MRLLKQRVSWIAGVVLLGISIVASGLYYGVAERLGHSRSVEMSMAVINWQKLWGQLPAMIKIRQELNTRLQSYHQEFALYEKNLQKKQQELANFQKKVNFKNPRQIAQLEVARNEFSQAVNDTQKKAEMYQKKVNDDYQLSLKELQEKVRGEMDHLVQEKKIRIVLNSQYISHFDPVLDITSLIVERLKHYRPSSMERSDASKPIIHRQS